jgi:prophage regulatory protein
MKSPGLRLINRRELLALVPLSERTILEMERGGAFPRRFTLTPRQVAWDLREIERWMAGRREARGKIAAP